MRMKNGKYIHEVDKICVRKDEIQIGNCFYQTKEQTQKIAKQLLEKGYADLTEFTGMYTYI